MTKNDSNDSKSNFDPIYDLKFIQKDKSPTESTVRLLKKLYRITMNYLSSSFLSFPKKNKATVPLPV